MTVDNESVVFSSKCAVKYVAEVVISWKPCNRVTFVSYIVYNRLLDARPLIGTRILTSTP